MKGVVYSLLWSLFCTISVLFSQSAGNVDDLQYVTRDQLHDQIQDATLNRLAEKAFEGFVAGTQIKTIHGYQSIETLEKGMSVVSFDEKKCRQSRSKILDIRVTQQTSMIIITLAGGQRIQLAPESKFYDHKRQLWVMAKDKDDIINLFQHNYGLQVASIQTVAYDQPIKTYLLILEPHQNFFITKNDFLVHNWGVTLPLISWTIGESIKILGVTLGGVTTAAVAAAVVLVATQVVVSIIVEEMNKHQDPHEQYNIHQAFKDHLQPEHIQQAMQANDIIPFEQTQRCRPIEQSSVTATAAVPFNKQETPSAFAVDFVPLEALRTDCMTYRIHCEELGNDNAADHWQQRIDAVDQTIKENGAVYDYSQQVATPHFNDEFARLFDHQFGTSLDKRLHQELCDIRRRALALQQEHADNFYAQQILPLVNVVTACAKNSVGERDLFSFVDFAESLVEIVDDGASFLNQYPAGRGFVSSVKKVASLHHLVELKDGALALGSALVNPSNWIKLLAFGAEQYGHIDDIDNALFMPDAQHFHALMDRVEKGNRDRYKPLYDHAHALEEQIKKMSWDQILEASVEIGATYCLDTLLLGCAGKALKKGVTATSNIMNEVIKTLPNDEFFLEAYIADTGIIAKMAVEEGSEAAAQLAKVAKKNPGVVTEALEAVVQSSVVGKDGKISRCICKKALEIGEKTGTIWDYIKPTDKNWFNTKIPKSFELVVNNKKHPKWWVSQNATDHMMHYIVGAKCKGEVVVEMKAISHGMPIRSQSILESFKAAVEHVLKRGLPAPPKGKKIPLIIRGEWELGFALKSERGPLPIITHALYKPRGHQCREYHICYN